VYFLGLLTSQRDLFTIGQNAAVNTANLSPLVAAGVVYLLITVPLTHAINHIDRWTNRFSNPGARRNAQSSRALRGLRREEALQSQAPAAAEHRS
jgi:polar amino acid transport system permease protein